MFGSPLYFWGVQIGMYFVLWPIALVLVLLAIGLGPLIGGTEMAVNAIKAWRREAS